MELQKKHTRHGTQRGQRRFSPGGEEWGTPLYKPYRVSGAVVESENSFIYRIVTR